MCDCLVALPPATGGATLFAKNSDRPPDETMVTERLGPRSAERWTRTTHLDVSGHDRATIPCWLTRPAWSWGAEHGVNAAGVAAGNEAIYTTLDPRSAAPALTGLDLVRLVLERAERAEDAVALVVDLLDRYGQGGTGHDPAGRRGPKAYWSSLLVADPQRAYVIETSGRDLAVEQVAEVRAISNRTTIPDFDARHRHPRQPVERLVDPRWHASQRVLAERPVTVEGLADHLRTHEAAEPGWSVCMHVDGIEVTTASMIAELRGDGPQRIHWLLGSPCQASYSTIELPGSAGPVAPVGGRP